MKRFHAVCVVVVTTSIVLSGVDAAEAVRWDLSALSAPPPEYVILRKLQFYQEGGSDKHLIDIQNMLEMSTSSIDRGELEARISQLGLSTVWKKLSER
jgi:hypothetical protein